MTAYITYALDGYKVGAVREFEFQNGKKRIPADTVLYVESRLHRVIYFVMENGIKEYARCDRLDEVEKEYIRRQGEI